MTKRSKAWYTYEDHASIAKGRISEEQLAIEKELDEVMSQMVKKLDYITQYVTEVHQTNVVQAINVLPHEHGPSENDRVEKVYFVGNQVLGTWLAFQRLHQNQGWNFGIGWSDG